MRDNGHEARRSERNFGAEIYVSRTFKTSFKRGNELYFQAAAVTAGDSTEMLRDRWEAAGIRVFDVCSGSGRVVKWVARRGFYKSVEIRLIGS